MESVGGKEVMSHHLEFFKDFFSKAVAIDPDQRATTNELLGHPHVSHIDAT